MDAALHKIIKQRGAYALEFALVFPILFILLYALLSFGLMMTAQQALNYAAETAVRVALMSPPAGQTREGRALASARANLSWLSNWVGTESLRYDIEHQDNRLRLSIHYSYAQAPLMPVLGPSSVFAFLLPNHLVGEASVNLSVAGVIGESL
ncbi:TadE/TadG family type IV pilus assembly protein [Alcaligenes endophyticus]|uniref:Pilus assembly protein n=1 Tax=Alcaligenes endophyticus TaxID=1929088 RepID=A0ABT8EHF1_9BURK|nr:TadE/TadG family type IV pilus assembly protein [Alcaligenes endophyticus]MCX5592046.1 pilus assembly protein [Alcaligenes endophyticus]MDN4120693.1 pilus assembly protein [Alcaligenes endophyticus]